MGWWRLIRSDQVRLTKLCLHGSVLFQVDMASGAYGNVSLTFGVQERQTGKVGWGGGRVCQIWSAAGSRAQVSLLGAPAAHYPPTHCLAASRRSVGGCAAR